jgi:hypothetical protein
MNLCTFDTVDLGTGLWRHTCTKCGTSVELPDSRFFRQCPILDVPTGGYRSGPGDELKKLLAKWGIVGNAACGCGSLANQMNLKGPDWCEQEIDHIAAQLMTEANRRRAEHERQSAAHRRNPVEAKPPEPLPLLLRMPFQQAGAKAIIKKAIRNSRKTKVI